MWVVEMIVKLIHEIYRLRADFGLTPNLPTNIVDFRGFDSTIILTFRGGIPRPIVDFPQS